MSQTTDQRRGPAVSVRGKPVRRTPLGWLFWLALLLLIALAVGVALFVLNVNDEDDDPGVDLQDDAFAPAQVLDA